MKIRLIQQRRLARWFAAAVFVASMAGCSLTDVQDPSSILDPDLVKTQDGAKGLYISALAAFEKIYGGMYPSEVSHTSFALVSGLASDEFSARASGAPAAFNLRQVIATESTNQDEPYSGMHKTRLYIDEATGALREYGFTTPKAYIGELQALQGYLYVMFGELYCSGVPFGKAVYGGDIVHGKPLTTQEIYERAVIYFDSAITSAVDSLPIKRLAQVGKARALVNLGRFAEAAAVVSQANVPTSFTYQFKFSESPNLPHYLAGTSAGSTVWEAAYARMANRAGENGLNYLDAGSSAAAVPDPRVKWYASSGFAPGEFPDKFRGLTVTMALADGIEARLIEAEAKLQAKDYDGWRTVLNTLRQSGLATPIAPLPVDSTTTAADSLRVSVMFRERAFWLFGTGHRFGDMRRLVRQYRRGPGEVFPQGLQPYLQSPDNFYSRMVVLEPPRKEIDNNPNYQGCLNYDA